MKDVSDTPFWGKQKPLAHYFKHGVIKFKVNERILYYQVKQITKINNGTISKGIVKDKKHLDKLLSVKVIQDVLGESVPQ